LGQETSYYINYRNLTSEPLATAEIRVSFPTDFTPTDVEPKPTGNGLVWRLGSLPVDGRGTLKVTGIFTGSLGTVTAVQVVGTYRPASFNSDFETLATKVLTYDQSVLNGTLELPAKVLPGDHLTFKYTLQNTGQTPFQNMQARLTLPEGFQRDASSTGSFDGRIAILPIGELAPGATTTVAVSGSFASGVSGDEKIVAEAGRVDADGNFQPAQHSEATFTVLAGDLSLKLVLNGNDSDMAISYGSTLHFGLRYENTAAEDLKGVKLRLRLEPLTTSTAKIPPALVAWKTFLDSSSGTRSGDTITWDEDQIPNLARLEPHDHGTLEPSVSAVPAASGTQDLAFRATFEAEISSVGGTAVHRTVKSTPIIVRYLTDANFIDEARYTSEEGAPLGSGPLPPVVGQTTTYRIHWEINKHFHELKDMKVTAILPKIASWPGNVITSAGQMDYDSVTKTVTWTLNRMPQDVNQAMVDFDVSITPTEADVGRFADLLGEARFEATDAFVNSQVIITKPALSTDLENDEGARGKGVVKKP
jgi:uncharacterized repeat protein (TIGR01451 family)